ncbi:hypothetical protein CK203_080455 [Vitis vinifera]|uniref:Uncharacterized protein n=1 Tax=Vitis vinifera TaxID=29760 RepID=A0A438E7C8_VITVI|nr:hypothetical protein CK203_080455 [Vitis vinifera]
MVCKLKESSGLGFWKISLRNQALLSKWLWRYPKEGFALWHQPSLGSGGLLSSFDQIACASAGEARKWMEAFDHAKQQAEYELSRGSGARNKLNMETEINLEGHRHSVRRYAHGLKELIKIGQGPESLLRQSSNLGVKVRSDGYIEGDGGDAIEAHEWKCVRTIDVLFGFTFLVWCIGGGFYVIRRAGGSLITLLESELSGSLT